MLSPTTEQKVLTFGSTEERVCHVCLQGPVHNLFIVVTHLSYYTEEDHVPHGMTSLQISIM